MEMKDTLLDYTEGQIKCAKDAVDALSTCVVKIKEFPLPQKQPPIDQSESKNSAADSKMWLSLNIVQQFYFLPK